MFLHDAAVVCNSYYGRGCDFGVNYQAAVEATQAHNIEGKLDSTR